MVSTKNFTPARLCLVILIVFNNAIGFGATPENNRVSVTDFKYYRKINYRNQQLLIYKNPKIKSIFYLSDKNQQDFTKIGNNSTLNFKVDSAKTNYKIGLNNKKIIFLSKQKTTYFESFSNSICAKALEENAAKLTSKSIVRGIQSINIMSLADSTCNDDQKEKIGLYLSDMLTTENAWLSDCYANEAVKKLIEADPNYLNYTGSVYSKYLRLVQKINDDEHPIQISCKISTPGKLGSFNESVNPEKISFDWENLIKAAGSDNKLPDKIKATLAHELFHYGEQLQTPSDIASDKCINESYAEIFTNICTSSKVSNLLKMNSTSTTLTIPTSEQIAISCKSKIKIITSGIKSSDTTKVNIDGVAGTGAVVANGGKEANASAANNIAQQPQSYDPAIQANLANGKNPVTQSDFTQPSDADYSTLTSQTVAGTTTGQAYTVPANSNFGQTVQNTLNSFANSGNTLTNKLNTAVAAATTPAVANTTTLAATGSTNTTTGSSYAPTSTTNITTVPTTSSDVNTNSRMPATVDESGTFTGTTGKQVSGSGPSEMGGGKGSSTTSRTATGQVANTKAVVPQSGGAGASGGGSSSGGNGSTVSTPQKNGNTTQASGSDMVKTIQSLKAFNTVTGGQYQEIKKYYTNPQFQNLLQTYDMRIMVKNASGQYVAIGVDSKKAKKVFNDDGQILKTIEEKK